MCNVLLFIIAIMHEFVLCVYIGVWTGLIYHPKSCNVTMNELYHYIQKTIPDYAIVIFMNNHFL